MISIMVYERTLRRNLIHVADPNLVG